jgi:hypothetical protein
MNKGYFLQKLSEKRGSIPEEYNYDLLPETFLSHDKIAITCIHHGLFHQKAHQHLSGAGCRVCGRIKCDNNRALNSERFITKSKKRFGEKFDYSKVHYIRKDTVVTLTCPDHGEFLITPDQHYRSIHGCQQCDNEIPRAIRKSEMLEKARRVHGDKYDYSKVNYINANEDVEIICRTHGSFWQNPYSHAVKKTDCPKCVKDNSRLTLDDFIKKSKKIHGEKYEYGKVVLETTASLVTITCKKHGDFKQRAASHLDGSKCKKCFREENTLSTEDFIKNAREAHGDTYDYSKVKYCGNKEPVEIICHQHGSFWQKPNSHVSSKNGCRLCFESKGEKAIEVVLKKYGIKHVREYQLFPHRYRFDFFLPEFNIYIEFHGHQHYMPVELFGGDEGHQGTKERDEIKRSLVAEAGGNLIVLNYLNLRDGSVENELIRRLRKVYRYWFLVDDKIITCKTAMDVYKRFDIPLDILVRNLELFLTQKYTNIKTLF